MVHVVHLYHGGELNWPFLVEVSSILELRLYKSPLLLLNIYNGNIFPSLNPAKNFQFISRWTESTKSSAVGPNHRAVINTWNEVKSPLLWEFWIYNFSLRSLERVLGWKHCKYKEWVSFFWVHGEWIVARNKQIGREPLRGSRDLFVPRYDSFPMNPEKKTLIP